MRRHGQIKERGRHKERAEKVGEEGKRGGDFAPVLLPSLA